MTSPLKDLDLAALTLCDALDLAALVEEEAQERYEEFAHSMALHRDFEAAKFFRFMVDVEGYHTAALGVRRQELCGDAPVTVRREMIFDIEAPEYHTVYAGMSLRRALEVSLEAEQKAWRFFDEALAVVRDPVVRELFEELREDEARHLQMIEDRLAALPPDPADDLMADFDDPPAPQ